MSTIQMRDESVSFRNSDLVQVLLSDDILDAEGGIRAQQGLKHVKGILTLVMEAFENIKEGSRARHLTRLDGLVTDCACQIRAIENLIFEKRIRERDELKIQIREGLSKVEEAQKAIRKAISGKTKTIRAFINKNRELFSILSDVDVKILVLSTMLHKVKHEVIPKEAISGCLGGVVCPGCHLSIVAKREVTIVDGLQKVFGGPEGLKLVVSKAQEHLALISIERLLELIQEARCSDTGAPLPICETLTKKMFKSVQRGEGTFAASSSGIRRELPASLTVEAALQLASAHEINVLVKGKLTEHCIESSSSEGKFDVSVFCKATIEGKHARLLQRVYPNKLKNRTFSDEEHLRFDFEKTIPLLEIGDVFSESKMGCSSKEKTDSSVYLGIVRPDRENPFLVIAGLRSQCLDPFDPQVFSEIDLSRVIRENTSNHFQFTDGKGRRIEEIQELRDRELGDFADMLEEGNRAGRESGCIQENARLFVTTHIFPSSFDEEFPDSKDGGS